MTKLVDIKAELDVHKAVSDERFKELFLRLRKIEALLIGVAGTLIIGMAGMIWQM